MGAKMFGARGKRLEDPDLLTGRGNFTDDIHLHGALEAAFVRSPHGHAKINAIETARAAAHPGVHRVFTAADLPGDLRHARVPFQVPNPAISQPFQQRLLEEDEVCFVGEPIALVIADSRYIAEDAAELVEIDYEVLPAVSDCRDALDDASPHAHLDSGTNECAKFTVAYGDAAAAFADAPHVYRQSLWSHRGGGFAIENRAVLANPVAGDDVVTMWSATQSPFLV